MQWKTWSGLAAACLMLAALPLSAEEIIASGEFYNAHHPTSGRALIVARDGSGYELRFEDFTSDAGPDLFIYLSTAEEPHTDSAIKNAEFEISARARRSPARRAMSCPTACRRGASNPSPSGAAPIPSCSAQHLSSRNDLDFLCPRHGHL